MSSGNAPLAGTAAEQVWKRIVIIDQTSPDGVSATGALKKTYFGNIPAERLLMAHHAGTDEQITLRAGIKKDFFNSRVYPGISRPLALIRAFRPDIMIYRPLQSAPLLHQLACTLALEDGIPSLLWFMDDWPARLRAIDPSQADAIERDLRQLAERALGCFAISASMASTFQDRYGGPRYQVAHNGIQPEDWLFHRPSRSTRREVLLRYSGALAPDMSLNSMISLAHAVADLVARGKAIRLEIRTQSVWLRQHGQIFKGLPGVSIKSASGSPAYYRRWIAGADVGIIAYNFDAETIRYTQYSFANKLPELMAAGNAVLAIGPIEIETIRYLKEHGVAAIADRPDALPEVLWDLLNDCEMRRTLAAASLKHAKLLTLDAVRSPMEGYLVGPAATDTAIPDAVTIIREEPQALGSKIRSWLHKQAGTLKLAYFWFRGSPNSLTRKLRSSITDCGLVIGGRGHNSKKIATKDDCINARTDGQ